MEAGKNIGNEQPQVEKCNTIKNRDGTVDRDDGQAANILEYGYPIYCCASDTSLQRIERVQLSATRIITGLRNSCPKDIVLYEANLQLLRLRRIPNLVKSYNKFYSLEFRNRTSAYLKDWCNNQRFKRNSPFSQVTSCNLITNTEEQHHLPQSIDSSWIPSHVNIQGNEIAYALAKAGADDASVPSAPLTYLELFSRAKSRNKTIWIIPPVYHWYQGSQPGGCQSIDCNRCDQTTLTRFLMGISKV
ncbi:hypothetical protein AVEN_215431-1 [Araneus ventricosus]|uniref:RNase H type-1 domain-containing protein n=1 Tax=Araneus ventricosus TaxID=182803 RepID=A0A4Y2TSJ0_ARAVE|nr:hypothetical protein AVEN_215431-1 [Araneus ventricosus]